MVARKRWLHLILVAGLCALLPACAVTDSGQRDGVASSLKRLAAQRPDSFRFVVLGDSQFIDDAGFRSIVTQAQSRGPAFVVQVGDLILTDGVTDAGEVRRQWARYLAQSKPLIAPFFPAPGNHDSATPAALEVWREVWGPRYYSFDYGNSHFVVLDSCVRPEAGALLGSDQTAWLRKDLAATRAEHVFVFFHHPLWLLAPKGWEAYHALFRSSRVKAVFAGHNHYYRYDPRDGIDYIMTIAVLRPAPEFETGRFPHLVEVDVSGAQVAASIFYQAKNLPLDAVDPAIRDASYAQYATLSLRTMPARATDATLTVTNPLAQPVRLAWRLNTARTGLRITPDAGSVELQPKEKLEVAVKVEPTGAEPARLPEVEVEVTLKTRLGREVSVTASQRILMTPDLARLGLAAKVPGRVVLVGPEKAEAMTVILKAMGLTTVQAAAPADLEKLWPSLKAGDTLVTAHNALDNDSGFGAWFHEHRADVMKFLESGGRLVACLGYADASLPVIQDFGLVYRRHDRAWTTERKGDNGELHVAKTSPLAPGLIGMSITYRLLPMVSGWFELKDGGGWTVLATDSLGGAVVVVQPFGRGWAVLSAARLAAHHHMLENYNQQRIWANLLQGAWHLENAQHAE